MENKNHNLRWISVRNALPPVDEEVIVLTDDIHGNIVPGSNRVAYGHVIDTRRWTGRDVLTGKKKHHIPVDYDGWNIPGVHHWFPCPALEEDGTEGDAIAFAPSAPMWRPVKEAVLEFKDYVAVLRADGRVRFSCVAYKGDCILYPEELANLPKKPNQ